MIRELMEASEILRPINPELAERLAALASPTAAIYEKVEQINCFTRKGAIKIQAALDSMITDDRFEARRYHDGFLRHRVEVYWRRDGHE